MALINAILFHCQLLNMMNGHDGESLTSQPPLMSSIRTCTCKTPANKSAALGETTLLYEWIGVSHFI